MVSNEEKDLHSNIADELKCDYLVIGAGTTGMSFIDTLLTENTECTVVLADRNLRPGGHWVHAYPYCKLHQPSCCYGVNSLPLGKVRDSKGLEVFDHTDRATAAEVVEYYERVVEQFVACGRVRCLFGAEYKGEEPRTVGDGSAFSHTVIARDGEEIKVSCAKLVTVATAVVVPSMRKPTIPIHGSVNFTSVNKVPDAMAGGKYRKFVVLGAGKTGVDAVVELLTRGVDQSCIQWVISRDVWYMIRDKIFENNWSYSDIARMMKVFLAADTSKDVMLRLEQSGYHARLIPDGPAPEVFKGPNIDSRELEMLRTVKDLVRLGRVTSIESDCMTLERGKVPFSSPDTVFIDCMAESGFYGYGDFKEDFKTFEPGRVNLGPFFAAFNPSFTSAIVAYLESTFSNDEIKNSLCFFQTKKYIQFNGAGYIGTLYGEMKTQEAVLKFHSPAGMFFLKSRTNYDSINRSGKSLVKLMWAAHGPLQLDRIGKKFVKKVSDGGYSDIDHQFGMGREIQINTSSKSVLRKKNKKVQGSGGSMYPPLHLIKKGGKSRRWGCCMTDADTVVMGE